MVPSAASPRDLDPDAIEFVRFCYRRRRVGWPELYDEMCAVASRGLFRGMGPDELAGLGIGFCLFDMPALAGIAATVVAEEQAKRRPVAVAILAEIPPGPIVGPRVDVLGDDGTATAAATAAVDGSPTFEDRDDVAAAVVQSRPERAAAPDASVERTVDVKVRLTASPAIA
jgi:hypothetical protein